LKDYLTEVEGIRAGAGAGDMTGYGSDRTRMNPKGENWRKT
jgi:hypothetical protein